MVKTIYVGSEREVLNQYIGSLEVGRVQSYKNMEVVPLFTDKKSSLDYIVLDQAMKRKGFSIEETGNVNNLEAYNNTNKDVLIIKGEYMVGGKQNRMMTRSALIKKKRGKKHVNLPVHCIEQGRWNTPGEFYGGKVAAAGMRHGLTKESSGERGQHATWENVSYNLKSTNVNSSTSNFDEFHKKNKKSIDDYVSNFKFKKGQVGFVVAVTDKWGNKNFYVDLFDKPVTMKKHFDRMLESYVTEAITNSPNAKPKKVRDMNTQQEAIAFLLSLTYQGMSCSGSVDLGMEIEISEKKFHIMHQGHSSRKLDPRLRSIMAGPEFNGSGLVYKDTVVYFGASKMENPRNRFRIPAPEFPRIPGLPPGRESGRVYPLGALDPKDRGFIDEGPHPLPEPKRENEEDGGKENE